MEVLKGKMKRPSECLWTPSIEEALSFSLNKALALVVICKAFRVVNKRSTFYKKNQTVEDLQVTTNKVEGNLVESNFENSTKRKKQTVKDSRPLTQLSSLNLIFL
jgi:hypothetical protein